MFAYNMQDKRNRYDYKKDKTYKLDRLSLFSVLSCFLAQKKTKQQKGRNAQ